LGTNHTSLPKISRPHFSGIINREQLFRVFDQSPVTWVSAPAGYGKTTLVASYVHAQNLPCLWYQLDERDADAATSFHYLRLAGKKAAPRKRTPLPLGSPEKLQKPSLFSKNYFESLFARLKKRSVVVFDDYHEVPSHSVLHEIMREGLHLVPEDLRIIIISRKGPPPSLACLLARREIQVLNGTRLRFTADEFKAIIERQGHQCWTEAGIGQVHKVTDGWVGGLRLLLQDDQWSEGMKFASRHLPEALCHFFVQEVFSSLDTDTQEFVLKAAFLPKMSADTVGQLTGVIDAGVVLDRLIRENSFTWKQHHSAAEYRFHPLFRAFLFEKGKDFFSVEEISALQRRAAMLLQESGDYEAAANLYAQLNLHPFLNHADGEQWPWPVKVFTLGQFSLALDGQEVHTSPRGKRMPLNMLKVIIALKGDRGLGEQEISDNLWPDTEGDRAHSSFTTTLSRLRKLLGNGDIILFREGKVTLNSRYCWVDSWAFERLLHHSETAGHGNDHEKARTLLEKAVSLYRGNFLPGDSDQPWSLPLRERLRSKFLRAVEMLEQYHEREGNVVKAIDCLRKGIEVDPLAESLYQRLMLCLKTSVRTAEALAVYQRCDKTLQSLLGVEPSAKTREIQLSLKT